jgi:hypothetical protein
MYEQIGEIQTIGIGQIRVVFIEDVGLPFKQRTL